MFGVGVWCICDMLIGMLWVLWFGMVVCLVWLCVVDCVEVSFVFGMFMVESVLVEGFVNEIENFWW